MIDAAFQPRQCGDELEGRPGRVEAFGRPVVQRRRFFVPIEGVDLLLRHRAREDLRFEGRERADAEQLAVVDVHRHERARQPDRGDRAFARRLDLGVDRQLDVVAGHRRFGDELAARGRLAEGVDLDPGQARVAAQVTVEGVLGPVLADLVARLEGPVPGFFQLVFGDLADAAEHMRRPRASRVVADEHLLDLHAGKVVLVLFEVVEKVVADVAAQRHRRPRGDRFLFGDRLADLGQRHVDQLAEPGQHRLFLPRVARQFRGVDLEGEAGAVVDQRAAVAVEDGTAGSQHAELAGAVVLGLRQVLLAGEHLQVPEPEEENREEDDGDSAHDPRPQRQPGASRLVLGAQVHVPRLPAPSAGCPAAPPLPRPGPGAGRGAGRGRSANRGRRRRCSGAGCRG